MRFIINSIDSKNTLITTADDRGNKRIFLFLFSIAFI